MGLKPRLCTLVVLLTAAALAHAQLPAQSPAQLPSEPLPQIGVPTSVQTGSINGTVTDVNDDIVPHTIVILDGPGPTDHRTTTADSHGFFELNDLSAGTYHISVSANGFADYASAPIILNTDQNLDLPDISLKITTALTTVNATSYTLQEMAVQQVKVEETQRLLGMIPNFYVSYSSDFAPLSAGQKFSLAWKSAIDPTTFVITGIAAGIEQGLDTFPEWGQDWPGYGQRFGAAYASGTINLALTADILPTLLHQDPRYFYKGTGSIGSRALYSITTSTITCKGDNGKWQPNYSNVVGTFAAGGISTLYYPGNNSASLVLFNGLINLASEAANGLIQEFVLRHFTSHARPKH